MHTLPIKQPVDNIVYMSELHKNGLKEPFLQDYTAKLCE